ncbi:MAG: MATE family efflux transporter, partial [Clostridia bacterium]|nr:MATE family efflux transporter [Clostridia bacterium]
MAWQRKSRSTPQTTQDITEGVIWKQILLFFFPILLGTFFQQLYNTADAIIVGKFVGTTALAAVGGSTGALINLLVGLFVGMASGATVIISQFYGARKQKEVSDTVHTAAALGLISGAFLMVIGFILSPIILGMMNTPDDVIGMSTTYIRIYFVGIIPMMVYNIGSGILRAVGDSKRPLYFLICACMTNIVLDVVFVAGFEMGIAGAALATTLSQVLSAVLVTITLMRTHASFRLEPRKIRIHKNLLFNIIRIGLPAGLQSVMYSMSNVIIQSAVNSFGSNVMAAMTAYGKIDGLFWMIIGAYGIAVSTFVGQNFGARKFDRMRKCIRVGLGMAAGTTVLLSLVMYTCGSFIYRLFTSDAVVLDYGMQILRLVSPLWITYVCIEILSASIRGTGDSLIPTLLTLFGVCLLRVVWIT